MDEQGVRRWVDWYIKAWNSNDPDDIVALFTEDARYYTEPHARPWEGQKAIVKGWLERRDDPGTTTFDYRVISIDRDIAIVKGEAIYTDPPKKYSNLWEIRFDEGRAREFVEWWMEQ